MSIRNDRGRIGHAFGQLDREDGPPGDPEPTWLIRPDQALKDADPRRRPTLPPTWA